MAVHPEAGEYHVEPEEISIQTIAIPQITFTIGRFQPHFNRHNILHTHSFPFIDRPLANTIIFGEEGSITETGVSASYLIPSSIYQEVIFNIFSGENDALFNSASQDDVAGSFFYKNLRDLTKECTFEFDLSHMQGGNYAEGITRLYGLALTYKWRPLAQNAYRSFSWTVEYTRSEKTGDPALLTPDQTLEPHEGGVSTWMQYQWNKRYWIQARAEYFGLPKPTTGATEKYSGLIAFVPTEYSALRLQFDNIIYPNIDSEQRVMAQLNVSVGAHPAHDY